MNPESCYQSPGLLGLGLKLYLIIKQHILYKDCTDACRVFFEYA